MSRIEKKSFYLLTSNRLHSSSNKHTSLNPCNFPNCFLVDPPVDLFCLLTAHSCLNMIQSCCSNYGFDCLLSTIVTELLWSLKLYITVRYSSATVFRAFAMIMALLDYFIDCLQMYHNCLGGCLISMTVSNKVVWISCNEHVFWLIACMAIVCHSSLNRLK